MSSNTIFTTSGYHFRQLEPCECKTLEIGEEVCAGLFTEHEDGKRTLELIPITVTREAYYDTNRDKPCWMIGTNKGVFDIYSIYTKPEL